MIKYYDRVIYGAGIFGLYSAYLLGKKGYKVALVEFEKEPLQRASFINQARVHNGYHYPRSVSTASSSSKYYQRFNEEFSFAVNQKFKKIYAISAVDSLTNSEQFLKFSNYVNIPAEEINTKSYFNQSMVEAAFETQEFSYDSQIIKRWFVEKLGEYNNVDIFYNQELMDTNIKGSTYLMNLKDDLYLESPFVINATYASINQILNKFNLDLFNIKYEICEVVLTEPNNYLKGVGITVMDGPFFSVMPFGLTGKHSLTSVGHTPHKTSLDSLPTFECQQLNSKCTPQSLQNCNHCDVKPSTAWFKMQQLARKYLNNQISFTYKESLFAIKTILAAAEIDDSRPTLIKKSSISPYFLSIMSGKFNTIYDLEEILL